MSIDVMNCVWKHAPVQSGEFSVLLALADYADENGSCFPSIPVLARKARLKERQTQNCIRNLVGEGFVHVQTGAGPKGCNRYVVDTAAIEARSITRAPSADPAGEDEGAGREDQAGEAGPDDDAAGGANIAPLQSATGGVQPSAPGGAMECTQTTIEPPLEPSSEREACASADGQASEPGEGEAGAGARRDDPRKFEARVKRMAEGWPGWANSSTAWAVRQFAALTDAERAEAERCRAGYLAHCGGKALSVGTYLAEKKWLDLPAQALAAADPAARPHLAAPFGKLWGAKRMALLFGSPPQPSPPASGFLATQLADPGEAGRRARLERQARFGWPGVNRMDELAAQAKPWPIAAFEAAQLEELAAATEQVWTGTPLWDAWRDEFARRGWPWLPEMGRQRVASFPAGGPDGLEAFERAVRAGDGVGAAGQARKAG